jgi:hypothetical protein
MPRSTFTADVVAEFAKREGFVPAVLVDIQLRDGTTYYLSDLAGTYPVKIGAGSAVYSPWVKSFGPYDFSRGLQTDAGEIVLENLSGNSIERDVSAAMAAREFESALAVIRLRHELLGVTLMEIHCTIGEQHDLGDEASFRVQQLFDPGSIKVPFSTYATRCGWQYRVDPRCGSTGSASSCPKDFASCADPTRNAVERFGGIPLIPPALEFYKRMEEAWNTRRHMTERWKFDNDAGDGQLVTFNTRSNPSLSGPRTIAWGHCRGSGVVAFTETTITGGGSGGGQTSIHLMGEGKWSALRRLWIAGKRKDETDPSIVHFHQGADGTLGGGLAATSTGPDQGVDSFWANFPAGAQVLTLSRIAYLVVTGAVTGDDLSAVSEVLADFDTRLCRQFDGAGNQTSFAYTKNPTWQILDAIISFYLKPQATAGQALAAAEAARLAFADAATHAADCDFDLGGANKRFESCLAINQVTDLATLLNQMLQMCRSYIIEVDGQISVRMDKPRNPTFTMTSDHLASPLEEMKTNKRRAPNRIVGRFRDLNFSAIGNVQNCQRTTNVVTVNTVTDHLYRVGDFAAMTGVPIGTLSFNGLWKVTSVPLSNRFTFAQAGPNEGPTASGVGIFGRDESRFMEDSVPLDHEEHQTMSGQRGVGIAPSPVVIPVDMDFGNNTSERVERLVRYFLVRNLGVGLLSSDLAGAPYLLPRQLTARAWMNSVDANGNCLMAQLCGELIAIDKSCSEAWQGTYEIMALRIPRIAAGETNNTMIELTLLEYVPSAFTDVAGPQPVKSAAFTTQAAPANIQYDPP